MPLTPSESSVSPACAHSGSLWTGLWKEDLNFLLTNRIPRRLATEFMGWYSKIENRLLARASIAVWRRFAPDLDLSEALQSEFRSVHECFIRELRPGVRPIDPSPDVMVSPADAIVGAHGRVRDGQLVQAKGLDYTLAELVGDRDLAERYRGGLYVTLRLKSSFYHRFHAPERANIRRVRYISGDTWNVNPIAVERIERLFCRNERAVVEFELPNAGEQLALVPVAAILVASLKLHCLPGELDLRSRGTKLFDCDATVTRGAELGWFQHGSTIIALADGPLKFSEHVAAGQRIRMGQPLFRRLPSPPTILPVSPFPHEKSLETR
jgi:phosphatidylserine decarboxylase